MRQLYIIDMSDPVRPQSISARQCLVPNLDVSADVSSLMLQLPLFHALSIDLVPGRVIEYCPHNNRISAGMHTLAFFLGTGMLDVINVVARPLVFAGVLTWMVRPM